jgi:V8-like Glu-specific endopeptidase
VGAVKVRSVLLLALATGVVLGSAPTAGALVATVMRLHKPAATAVPNADTPAAAPSGSIASPASTAASPATAAAPAASGPVTSGPVTSGPVTTAPATSTVAAAVAGPAPSAASVGVLAHGASIQAHSCTAAVVASSGGNVIVTAAHCVSGSGAGTVFAPGYVNGSAPYGTWTVQAAYVEPAWTSGQDADADVAFLVVAPSAGNSDPRPVQQVVGGYPLGTAPTAGAAVRVTGYVSNAPNAITCTAAVYLTVQFPSFDCAGFAGGTSGGPWIAATPAGDPQLSGVIGGLHEGGCTVSTSYSSPFTAASAALLDRAESGAIPDTVPANRGDGC